MNHRLCLALLAAAAAASSAADPVPLSAKSYAKLAATHAVVVLQVNWGRYWGCGPYENAQLQRIAFRRLADAGQAPPAEDWELRIPNRLTAKPVFQPYAFLVEAGRYALSGLRFKVAASAGDVRIAELDASALVPDGEPTGGSFTAGAGEMVYIGHFGVDCNGEPTPWRFYIEGQDEFARYSAGFHERFPFTKGRPLVFRLLETESFGTPYDIAR